MTEAERSSSFPQWVAWASLALAVLLFFGNTTPALRERAQLAGIQAQMQQLRRQYDEWLLHAQPGTPGMAGDEEDLQSLLLAIDRLGRTPNDLLLEHPEPPPRRGAGEDPPADH